MIQLQQRNVIFERKERRVPKHRLETKDRR